MSYTIGEVTSKAEWQRWFARAPFPHMTQSWDFGEAKRADGWRPRRIVLSSPQAGAMPAAICQVLYRTVLGFPIVARINHGPLMLPGAEGEELGVYATIRDHWRLWKNCPLLIAPALSQSERAVAALEELGLKRRNGFNWESSRIDLSLSEAELRRSLEPTWRNKLRSAESKGVRFCSANTGWVIRKHAEHMRDKGYRGPSELLLGALWKQQPENFMVFTAANGQEQVAAVVAYRFREDHAHYYIGWTGPVGRDLRAGNFLLWNTMLALKAQGVRWFDLGGHNGPDAFSRFKLDMNGVAYQTVGEFLSR